MNSAEGAKVSSGSGMYALKESLADVVLLADTFRSGATLLFDFQQQGGDVSPVGLMLNSLSVELMDLLHRLPVESPDDLCSQIRRARETEDPAEWQRLSDLLRLFLCGIEQTGARLAKHDPSG